MTNFTRDTTGKKGIRVSKSEHTAKTPSLRTGFFAVLSSLLRGRGSGAPHIHRASSAPVRPHSSHPAALRPDSRVRGRLGLAFAPFALAIAALLALAASASAASARPFESQITEADGTAFAEPTGLAVDNSDDLWVTDVGPNSVDKFDPLGASA